MKTAFQGFPAEALHFLAQLGKNNDREWFTPRKQQFEELVRAPMLELVSELHREMLRFAPEYVGEPSKCVFRIYRDTRFSKDKTPYKDHIAASFWRNDSAKGERAGFYFSVSPKEIEIAGGLYHPDAATLRTVRQHIADNAEEFRATYTSKRVKALLGDLQGETAVRAPKGFDPAHPAIDLIRQKQYLLYTMLDPAVALTPKLFDEVLRRFEILTPFMRFLNAKKTASVNLEFHPHGRS